MSTNDMRPTSSVDDVERLPSLAALQVTHKELLRAHRQAGDTPEMLDRIETFIHQGQATGALLDAEEERWMAQGVLDYWSATLFRADRRAPDATLADFDPNLAPELPDELCPYVGLDPFRETMHTAFFGRERLVTTLVEKLADSRLLAVVGPSGSGKSSLVLAGLMPALQQGALPGSEAWHYMPRTVPGSNPLANLVRLIQAAGGEREDPVARAQHEEKLLRENRHRLLDLVSATGEMPVVGVVDQFEEVFTLCNDQQVLLAFIDNLINIVQAPGPRHTVILTMRTDFEPFMARLPDFYPLFEQALVRVTPLSASELREAIEKPAEKVGLKFESGIVDQLVQDLLGEPAGLPLLQFTLLKLWDNRARNRITWAVYNQLGGGRLALSRSADAIYDKLIPEDQVTARRIFLRLVRPGEGLEFTSNRVLLRILYQAGEAQDRVDRVLDKLIAAHLLRVSEGDVAADTQVEVAHEALVRNWPTLVAWLEEERHNIRRRQGITDAAEHWIASGRDAGALYTTGSLLQEAQHIVNTSGVPLNGQEAEFISASEKALETAQQEKEAARQRELQIEIHRANQEAAAAKRFRRLTAALVVVAILALIASLVALGQRETAVTALMSAQAGATQVAANLKIAQDSLGAQVGLIDQLGTAEAQKAALSARIRTLETIFTSTPRTTPTQEARPSPTPTVSQPSLTYVPPPSSSTPTARTPATTIASTQSATAAAATLAAQRSQVQATQTAIALGAQVSGTADANTYLLVNLGSLTLRAEPSDNADGVVRMSPPNKLIVLDTSKNPWFLVQAPTGEKGWIDGRWEVYEGNAARLPADLRFRVISDRTDLDFVNGIVVSHDGATREYPLRSASGPEARTLVSVPIGTELLVLKKTLGTTAYGSGEWYVVTVPDPYGTDYKWTGFLPVEAVRKR